jgi:methionyl-tRNA formyltransferase
MPPTSRTARTAIARLRFNSLRTVYLGTSDFAARVLKRLADSPHRPTLVVTPPDRPRGRGQKVGSPPAAETARELGIELLQFASVNDHEAVEAIRSNDTEVPVVCGFGQLIGAELLAGPLILNVHPSLLPRWRGAAPIERTLMAGDAETGVSVMRVTEGLDSGPVGLQESLAIKPGENFGSLSTRLAELGGELIVRALELHSKGDLEFEEQDEDRATYAEKITAADRVLDPARPAFELTRRVRALTPNVGAHLELASGEWLGVCAASVHPDGAHRGTLEEVDGALLLGCAEGVLRLDRVHPAGGREMTAAEYLRGHSPPELAPMRED